MSLKTVANFALWRAILAVICVCLHSLRTDVTILWSQNSMIKAKAGQQALWF